ncbi:MAG: eukaryotic-like serine/threonine-protein kinase [Gemmatimonadales bacterium]|jgi:serine/threonine-protein kinase|nr:eukaryotic-like serine/threonine-protein kinase [Gemmatimonadales bacterium]
MLALVRQAFTGVYEVDREIGKGGNARIFLARDPSGQSVALKILHPELLVSVAADRFLREIQLASKLDNPHIAKILDSGEREWLVYYVMSFVEGATLRERLDTMRCLPIAETLKIACDLLDALGHAHGQGIIHRDVKPANIVLSAAGAVLLDFGIARAVLASGTDQLTRSGIAVGTSTYMSPEQVTALADIDHRSDLYSVGCVLFECLAGQPPFMHRNEAVVLQLHLTQPPPDVRTLRSDTPVELAKGIAKAMAKSPGDRWRTALEMREVLAACPV